MAVTCTIDIEEYEGASSRITTAVNTVLDYCSAQSIHLTAFVVGDLARARPDLIRQISTAGHEIGLHGPDHRLLSQWVPTEFISRCKDDRSFLADLAGAPIQGFRAPIFSLTPEVPWAPEALADSGFSYSSSVVPAKQTRGNSGFPGAPREPFRWSSGVVEMPAGLYGRLPVGGAYLRLLPRFLVKRMKRGLPRRAPWVYAHPYDFDTTEERRHLPGTGRIESRLLFMRRRLMTERLGLVVDGVAGLPLGELLPELIASDLPVFYPVTK